MLASPTRKKESMMLMNTGKEVILLKNYKNPVLPPVDEDTFNYPDYNYDYEDDSHKSKKSHKKRKKKSLIKKKDILHELNVDDLSDQDYEGDDTENSNETYSNNVKSMKSIVKDNSKKSAFNFAYEIKRNFHIKAITAQKIVYIYRDKEGCFMPYSKEDFGENMCSQIKLKVI